MDWMGLWYTVQGVRRRIQRAIGQIAEARRKKTNIRHITESVRER